MLLSFDQATTFLTASYGYVLFFGLVMIEGPVITILASFLASLGGLNVIAVFILAIIADISSDCLYYALGYWGSKPGAARWFKFLGISAQHAQSLEEKFAHHGRKLLLVGKMSHGVGGVFLVAAGLAKMPFRTFLLFNTLATIPKTFILVLLGYNFGSSITRIHTILDGVAAVMLGLVVVAVIYYLVTSAKTTPSSE